MSNRDGRFNASNAERQRLARLKTYRQELLHKLEAAQTVDELKELIGILIHRLS